LSINRGPNKRSKDDSEKKLGSWISNQKHGYKNQTRVMKDESNRKLWEEFVRENII
jgi:hypothetical protein